MTREKVEKNAAPSITARSTPRSEKYGEEVDDGPLGESPQACRDGLAENERGSRGGAHEELVEDPQIPLPDYRDAVEDGYKEYALGQDPRGHEVDVAHVSRGYGTYPGKDLAEDQEPQGRLHRARKKLGRVVQQLARLHSSNGERPSRVAQEEGERVRPRG
jgi:hypothetical protein